jgi:hypothetical protein
MIQSRQQHHDGERCTGYEIQVCEIFPAAKGHP